MPPPMTATSTASAGDGPDATGIGGGTTDGALSVMGGR
jgi:hypothetical protein